MREAPVSGGDWSPPCVAVARLRRARLLRAVLLTIVSVGVTLLVMTTAPAARPAASRRSR